MNVTHRVMAEYNGIPYTMFMNPMPYHRPYGYGNYELYYDNNLREMFQAS